MLLPLQFLRCSPACSPVLGTSARRSQLVTHGWWPSGLSYTPGCLREVVKDGHLWWPLLLVVPIALLILGRRHSTEAAATVVQAIVLKMVEPPMLERLEHFFLVFLELVPAAVIERVSLVEFVGRESKWCRSAVPAARRGRRSLRRRARPCTRGSARWALYSSPQPPGAQLIDHILDEVAGHVPEHLGLVVS